MTEQQVDRLAHWNGVYASKRPDEVSWFQAEPELSLKLIKRTGVPGDAAIIDVGGGASTLPDHLLTDGFRDVTLLDVSEAALARSKARLGARASAISWIAADLTEWAPKRRYDLWHDRAALHFLTEPADQQAYARTVRAALAPGGWAVIGGFAPGGPVRCSGLRIVQHDAASLSELLGDAFRLIETHGERHLTPSGVEQAFRFHVFCRV